MTTQTARFIEGLGRLRPYAEFVRRCMIMQRTDLSHPGLMSSYVSVEIMANGLVHICDLGHFNRPEDYRRALPWCRDKTQSHLATRFQGRPYADGPNDEELITLIRLSFTESEANAMIKALSPTKEETS